MHKVLKIQILAAAAIFASACPSEQNGSAPAAVTSGAKGKLRVVATTGMIADLSRRIAAEHADVIALMGPGTDPHLYKASEGDIRRLTHADVIFYNGLHLEGKMAQVLRKLAKRRPGRVVAVADSVDKKQLRSPPEYKNSHDPHIWFDVSLWSQTIAGVAKTLSAARPSAAAAIKQNAEKLSQELAALDAWVKTEISRIPKQQRVLVTAHDAFGYFGRRYGIEVVALQGLSTVAQAGLADVDRVAKLIVTRKIAAIFVESSVPKRTIEAVQRASEKRGHRVKIGGQLFSDAMGAPGTDEGTYPGMVRYNVKTIAGALMPPKGAN